MNKLLIDIPELIATPPLKLAMPKAGFCNKLYKAIKESHKNYVKCLGGPSKLPSAANSYY